MDKLTEMLADGMCPNANCDLGGDIELTATDYDGCGNIVMRYKCDCGCKWKIILEPVSSSVYHKPKNYQQIESEE